MFFYKGIELNNMEEVACKISGDFGGELVLKIESRLKFRKYTKTRILLFFEPLYDCVFQHFMIIAILW